MSTMKPIVKTPPSSVRILYKRAGMSHIFTSPDLPGLHVGDADLRKAFSLIIEAVTGLVELKYGQHHGYTTDMTFDEFEASLRPKAQVLRLEDLKPHLTVSIDQAA